MVGFALREIVRNGAGGVGEAGGRGKDSGREQGGVGLGGAVSPRGQWAGSFCLSM